MCGGRGGGGNDGAKEREKEKKKKKEMNGAGALSRIHKEEEEEEQEEQEEQEEARRLDTRRRTANWCGRWLATSGARCLHVTLMESVMSRDTRQDRPQVWLLRAITAGSSAR